MIYAVDEIQNPLPVKQCCLKVIQLTLEGEMLSFHMAKLADIANQHTEYF